MQTEKEAPARCRSIVKRECGGRTMFLRFGYWTLTRSQAQVFESPDAADNARRLKRQGGKITPA